MQCGFKVKGMKGMQKRFAAFFAATIALAAATGITAAAASAPGRLPLTVTLRLRNEIELDRLIDLQTTPGSRLYHHFISTAQFREFFAPTPAQYLADVAALQREGFEISGTSDNRTFIDVLTSPAVAERAFHTHVMPVVEGGARHYYAATQPQIPARLGFVGVVVGLERTQLTVGRRSAFAQDHHRNVVDSMSPDVGPDGGYGPGAITIPFDFPVRHGFDGKGVHVADMVDGAASDADIAVFLRRFGISRGVAKTKIVVVPQKDASGFFNDTQQADYDAEWILAAAPGVSLTDYYMLPTNNFTLINGFTKAVSDNVADVINVTLFDTSTCEPGNPTLALAVAPIFKQGAAEGISFESVEFNNGCRNPSGAHGPNYPRAFPMVPADNAYGLAVGSSSVYEAGSQLSAQTAWSGTGGGVSALFPVFAQQAKVSGVDLKGRNTPDFSLPASVNGNGPSYYYSYTSWGGGTARPNNAVAAGLLASYVQMSKSRLGAFDMTLFSLFKSKGYGSIFDDITAGCQTGAVDSSPICATRGYDNASGIGSFDGFLLGGLLR
jgi:kumamolisin